MLGRGRASRRRGERLGISTLDPVHQEGALLEAAMERKAPANDRLYQRDGRSNNGLDPASPAPRGPERGPRGSTRCSTEDRGNDEIVERVADWRADVGA